jgi:hypothetical protein
MTHSTRSRDLRRVRSQAAHAEGAGSKSLQVMAVRVFLLPTITVTHLHGSSESRRLLGTIKHWK